LPCCQSQGWNINFKDSLTSDESVLGEIEIRMGFAIKAVNFHEFPEETELVFECKQ